MADLVKIKLGDSEQQRTEGLNDNFAEIETRKVDKAANGFATLDGDGKVSQTAKNADKAQYFDDTNVTIKAALDGLADDIEDMADGTTVAGKAKALQPDTAPGNLKYYGTDEFGNIGWHDYTGGAEDPTGMSAVAFTAVGWTAAGDYHALSLPHGNKYPGDVYKEVSGEHVKAVVGIKRTTSNIVITADAPFVGYLLLG